MDEMEEIRERMLRRRTLVLKQQRGRYVRWTVCCVVFAVLVTVVAAITHAAFFGIVAAFFYFFAWNRWKEWGRIERWLSNPVPTNDQERAVWAEAFVKEIKHPPLWERVSDWIAGVTATALVLGVSFFVTATSGLGMRILYGLVYGLGVLVLLRWFLTNRRQLRQLEEHGLGDPWSGVT